MSHIVKGSVKILDLNCLKQACKELGLTFNENSTTVRSYYNTKVENCVATIEVPDAKYNIGVVKEEDGSYSLAFDEWSSGGLTNKLGPGLGKLMQTYSEFAVKKTVQKQGWRVIKQQLPDGVIMLRCVR